MAKTFCCLSSFCLVLPIATVFVFQFLNPVVTNSGQCNTTNKWLTAILLLLCGFSCAISSSSPPTSPASSRSSTSSLASPFVASGPTRIPLRQLGLATKLMTAAQNAMEQVFGVEYVSLHMHKSNCVAFNLYTETLGYKIHDVEAKYYANGEYAYDMNMAVGVVMGKPPD